MRKFSIIVAMSVVSLLNVATPNNCHHPNDAAKHSDSIRHSSKGGVNDGTSITNLLTATTNIQRNGDNQRLIEPLDDAEFGNIFVKNKNQLAIEYQPSACQLVQVVHLLSHPGCQSKAIASFACSGSCASYVRTSTSNFWQHERSCSCCQQTGSQEATFALDCPSLDPPYRKVKTYAPIECLCRSCTDLSREDIRPQEFVEALSGELSNGR